MSRTHQRRCCLCGELHPETECTKVGIARAALLDGRMVGKVNEQCFAGYACMEKAGLRDDPRGLAQPEYVNQRLATLLQQHVKRILVNLENRPTDLEDLAQVVWRGVQATGVIPPMTNDDTLQETESFVRAVVYQQCTERKMEPSPGMPPAAGTAEEEAVPTTRAMIQTEIGAVPVDCFDASVAASMLALRGAMETTKQRALDVDLATEATKQRQIEASAGTEQKRLETEAATEQKRLEAEAATEQKRLEAEAATEQKRLEAEAATEQKRLEAATEQKRLEAATEQRRLEVELRRLELEARRLDAAPPPKRPRRAPTTTTTVAADADPTPAPLADPDLVRLLGASFTAKWWTRRPVDRVAAAGWTLRDALRRLVDAVTAEGLAYRANGRACDWTLVRPLLGTPARRAVAHPDDATLEYVELRGTADLRTLPETVWDRLLPPPSTAPAEAADPQPAVGDAPHPTMADAPHPAPAVAPQPAPAAAPQPAPAAAPHVTTQAPPRPPKHLRDALDLTSALAGSDPLLATRLAGCPLPARLLDDFLFDRRCVLGHVRVYTRLAPGHPYVEHVRCWLRDDTPLPPFRSAGPSPDPDHGPLDDDPWRSLAAVAVGRPNLLAALAALAPAYRAGRPRVTGTAHDAPLTVEQADYLRRQGGATGLLPWSALRVALDWAALAHEACLTTRLAACLWSARHPEDQTTPLSVDGPPKQYYVGRLLRDLRRAGLVVLALHAGESRFDALLTLSQSLPAVR